MSQYNWQEDALVSQTGIGLDVRDVLQWTYLWMAFGLVVTTVVSLVTINTPALANLLTLPVVLGAIIIELLLVIAISGLVMRVSPTTAALLFFVYAALNGFTLTVIFFVYDIGTIAAAFASAAALFGAMTLVGFTTQMDLTKMGTYLFMGVIGLVIAMVVNMFLGSSTLDFVISAAGVLIFTGLTAYDTQKIKRIAESPAVQADGSLAMRVSIRAALTLYLDFINLFLFLLRLFGRRR